MSFLRCVSCALWVQLWADLMAAPGALASTVVPSDLWPSLGDFLQRFPEVHRTFTTSSPSDLGPACPSSFFRRSLAEVGPSVFEVQSDTHGAFECIAMVLDFLSSEPCHRVTRGPGTSFLCAAFTGKLAEASARACLGSDSSGCGHVERPAPSHCRRHGQDSRQG